MNLWQRFNSLFLNCVLHLTVYTFFLIKLMALWGKFLIFWFFFFWGGDGKKSFMCFLGSYSDDDIYLFDISQGTFELLNSILIIPGNYSNQELVKFFHFFLIFFFFKYYFSFSCSCIKALPTFFLQKKITLICCFSLFSYIIKLKSKLTGLTCQIFKSIEILSWMYVDENTNYKSRFRGHRY